MINPFSIVGLDISLTGTGVACCGHTRTIKSNAKLDIEPRVDKICDELFSTVDELSNKSAKLFVIEGLAFASKTGKVSERAFLHHMVRWMIWKQGKKFALVPPTTLKTYATGRGNADKSEVVISVTKNWPDFEAVNDNEADAVVLYNIGFHHCQGHPFRMLYGLPKTHTRALDKVVW